MFYEVSAKLESPFKKKLKKWVWYTLMKEQKLDCFPVLSLITFNLLRHVLNKFIYISNCSHQTRPPSTSSNSLLLCNPLRILFLSSIEPLRSTWILGYLSPEKGHLPCTLLSLACTSHFPHILFHRTPGLYPKLRLLSDRRSSLFSVSVQFSSTHLSQLMSFQSCSGPSRFPENHRNRRLSKKEEHSFQAYGEQLGDKAVPSTCFCLRCTSRTV